MKFQRVWVLIFLLLGCNIKRGMNLIKSNETFVVFTNTVLCGEETNMAVAGMMTCKLVDMTSHEDPL